MNDINSDTTSSFFVRLTRFNSVSNLKRLKYNYQSGEDAIKLKEIIKKKNLINPNEVRVQKNLSLIGLDLLYIQYTPISVWASTVILAHSHRF